MVDIKWQIKWPEVVVMVATILWPLVWWWSWSGWPLVKNTFLQVALDSLHFLSTDLYSRLCTLQSRILALFSWGAVTEDTIMAFSLILTSNLPDHGFHGSTRKRRRRITPLMIIRPVRLSEWCSLGDSDLSHLLASSCQAVSDTKASMAIWMNLQQLS